MLRFVLLLCVCSRVVLKICESFLVSVKIVFMDSVNVDLEGNRMEIQKIAIVDDSGADRSDLEKKVERYLQNHGIEMEICLFDSGEEFLSEFQPGMFTIIILDIYMGEMTGMETAKQIRMKDEDCDILFATTSDEFAVQSYEVRATYYLMKPVNDEKLEKGLDICLKDYGKTERVIQVTANRLPLEIPVPAIYFAETHRNVLEIHLKDRVIRTYLTFQNFLEMLGDDRRFLVCNKGCVVNMDHIDQMEAYDFVMKNGEKVQMRKRGNGQVRTEYLQYACEKMQEINA